MRESEDLGGPEGLKYDFNKILDVDRSTLTNSFIDRMEAAMRAVHAAQSDLKEIAAEAVQAEFRKHDVAAMRLIARLRLRDKAGEAREQLEALERVSRVVGFPLFEWAGRTN